MTMTQPIRLCLALLLPALATCGTIPPVPAAASRADAKFEPAPMPHVPQPRRPGTVGALEIPLPPKMPLGTGAVPVSNGPVRGSVVTGIRRSF